MNATWAQKLAAAGRDIKLSHSIFAMPFALLAMFLAARGFAGWGKLGLIVVCMFFARTFAMLANRYLDRNIDAGNARTAGRALPAGRLAAADVRLMMLATGAGLAGGAAMFGVLYENWWPLMLSPAVLAWLAAYGLMKRFTSLCHFFLGAALAISPVAAGLAIDQQSLQYPTLWWLAGFVLFWVGGFDIIYALQDVEVDRRDGLHSIPARVGREGSLIIAKLAHLAALSCLIMVQRSGVELGLGRIFFGGVVVVGVVLILEHQAAGRGRFSMAFFTANGVISCVLGAVGILDVLY